MSEVADIKKHLEYLFMRKIIRGLRDRSFKVSIARMYARDFLNIEPFISVDDAKTKVKTFVEQHKEFSDLYEYMDAYHEEQKTKSIIDRMQKYIDTKNIDKALEVAQQSP
jgi:hypothetical protein